MLQINILYKTIVLSVLNVVMSSEDNKIYQSLSFIPFIIYTDLESLIKKDGCKTNHREIIAKKVGEYIPLSFSMSAISSFKDKKY